jgi:ACT domain-containing protein
MSGKKKPASASKASPKLTLKAAGSTKIAKSSKASTKPARKTHEEARPVGILGASSAGQRAIVSVIGEDKIGIIAEVSGILAACHANILDISQSVMQEFFVMTMMVDLGRAKVPFETLKTRLNAKGTEMALRIDIAREDVFKQMHRV